MIGTRIEGRSGPWWPFVLMVLATAGCWSIAIARNDILWLVISTAPVFLGVAFWLNVRPPFAAQIQADGLELLAHAEKVLYEAIDGLESDDCGKDSFCMTLWIGDRAIDIPRALNISSRELQKFLLTKLPRLQRPPQDPALSAFLEQQLREFGPERVWRFEGRFKRQRRGWTTMLIGSAILFTGMTWAIGGHFVDKRGEVLPAVGVMIMIVGGCLIGIGLITGRNAARMHKAYLIVAPAGLALAQGKLHGALAWDEVLGVRDTKRSKVFLDNSTTPRGIVLKVAGANVVIQDVYDRPLGVIHDLIVELKG
jgi:hypothetical protein